MNNTINIKLTGLVGLLPRQNNECDTGLIGILPTVNRGFNVQPGYACEAHIPAHIPALKIREDIFISKDGSREPDLIYKDNNDDVTYMLFLFDKERMTPELASETKLKYVYKDDMNISGLQWVPNTRSAHNPDAGRELGGFANDKFLDKNFIPQEHPVLNAPSVIGSVVIETGEIKVYRQRGEFDFKVPGHSTSKEWTQPVFKDLVWELEPEKDKDNIKFVFENENGDTSFVSIDTKEERFVEIVNMELEAILDIPKPPRGPHLTIDFDMAIFYYLMKNVPINNMPLPHLIPPDFPNDTTMCIPMMLE